MPAPDYAWWCSSDCHNDVDYGYSGHRDPIICGFGKPSAFPRQLLDAVGLKKDLSRENNKMLLDLVQGIE